VILGERRASVSCAVAGFGSGPKSLKQVLDRHLTKVKPLLLEFRNQSQRGGRQAK
jgi:hypothetical protein